MSIGSRTLIACVSVLVSGCGRNVYPTDGCQSVVRTRSVAGALTGAQVEVIGSWDGWTAPGIVAEPLSDGWVLARMSLPPGEYGYRVVESGQSRLDPYQPLSTFRGSEEVSLLLVPDCSVPTLRIDAKETTKENDLSLRGTFLAASDGSPLDPLHLQATLDDSVVPSGMVEASASTGTFTVTAHALTAGKHTVTVEATDTAGKRARVAQSSVWVGPAPSDWESGLLYQIMVDRYRGDEGVALAPPATPGSRAGGTLSGVTAELERGTFDELGVTALWISPVYVTPDTASMGRDGHLSEGYHGYWPADNRVVDRRLGGAPALQALIAAAHRHGIRVLLDLVPNHVHEANPRYLSHRQDGWFNDGSKACVCGNPSCGWATHIQSCWFTSFLPDVRFQSDRAMHAAMEDATYWVQTFGADGVRIDAVPMMPRAATRRIVAALRAGQAPQDTVFTLGEVYTGPGEVGIDTIKYFLGPDGLDSAFDFPLMWAMRAALAHGRGSFTAIESVLVATERALRGSGAVLARMLDNHDTSRFISEIQGDGSNDPWARPPPQPQSPRVYEMQRLALALLYALPGLPVLYYGDEIGLAGASDPDSRRVMPALDSLSPEQQKTRNLAIRLGALRRCQKAMRIGARVPVVSGQDTYAFARDAKDGVPVLAVFSIANTPTSIEVPGGVIPPGDYIDVITGERKSISGAASIFIPPRSFRFLIPETSPCR